MESILPIAAFAERAQLSRRTIERKIAIGEIGADYVQRRGRRIFIDAAALVTLAPDLSRHDATQRHVGMNYETGEFENQIAGSIVPATSSTTTSGYWCRK